MSADGHPIHADAAAGVLAVATAEALAWAHRGLVDQLVGDLSRTCAELNDSIERLAAGTDPAEALAAARALLQFGASLLDDAASTAIPPPGSLLSVGSSPAEALERLAPFAHRRGVELRLHLGPFAERWPEGFAVGRIQLALLSMLAFALHRTPPGGILGLRGWAEDGLVVVEVADGGGPCSGGLEQIFDPAATTPDPGGLHSRFRLAAARHAARQLGGRLEALGTAQGVILTLSLPGEG